MRPTVNEPVPVLVYLCTSGRRHVVQGPDEFEEVFELAEPGKDFEMYSRTKFTRMKGRPSLTDGRFNVPEELVARHHDRIAP
jgi:hypothetical protein